MKHFTSYLLDNQVVTAGQLNDCISAQCINNQIIGYHAIKNGFITLDRLKNTVFSGKKVKPGSLAAYQLEGVFSSTQLFELLKIQAQNHNYLAMGLVNLRLLAMKDVNHHLRQFKKLLIDESSGFDGDPESDLQNEIINRHRSFFYNMGYATEVVSTDSEINPEDSHVHYATELNSLDDSKYYVGVSLSEEIVLGIAAQKNREFNLPYRASELYELFAQILFNLNYSICRKMNSLGRKVKHGPVQYYLPKHKHCITTRCRVMDGFLDIRIMS